MTDTRESDNAEPLMVDINNCDRDASIVRDVKNFIGGKWKDRGLVRNKRSGDDTVTSSTNPFNNKKRLIILVVLIILIIYLNATAVTWDDDGDRKLVNHRSHVPGMKDTTLLFNGTKTTATISLLLTTLELEASTKPELEVSTNQELEVSTKPELEVSTKPELEVSTISPIVPKGFLVWTKECQIPDLDPFTPDIMKIFKKRKLQKCSKVDPLTRIMFNKSSDQPILHFEDHLMKNYDISKIDCCYNNIFRPDSHDTKFLLSRCIAFKNSIALDPKTEYIFVKCKNSKKNEVYSNIHVLLPERPSVRKRLDELKVNDTQHPVNVILMGIDSVSRTNFIRSMPNTEKHIKAAGWFEMAGYNKMADNTFPNLMAILTGYNESSAYAICNPKKVGKLNECPMLWYDYRNAGYTTAYAEDTQSISTFNYLKVGFKKPPTDYYMRPVMLAAETLLESKMRAGFKVCLGFCHAFEYVYDYALKFTETYQKDPYFGLFWTNSFSHNSFDLPSSIDDKILDYLKKFNETGVLNQSIVILFSDHGMRFGASRYLASGHLEERLPFFFMWLPQWFQNQYPDYVNALKINKNRLTTPYDVHMTLKHILELSGRVANLPQAPDSPNSQTLFKTVPYNRSCEDVAIEDHWCTCRAFHNVDKNSKIVKLVAELTVQYINNIIKNTNNGTLTHLCARLALKTIRFSNKEVLPHEPANSTLEGYQLSFDTKPGGALFETTVRYDTASKDFTMTGTISRLNSYESQAKCVSMDGVKKYCFCKNK